MIKYILALLLAVPLTQAQVPGLLSRARTAPPITFNDQIVRIFQKNCQVCHHPGEVAPFSLMTYDEAVAHARQIKDQVQRRIMPVWKPVPGFGEFLNDRRLSDRDVDLIIRWVDSGAPEGDPIDAPVPMQFSDDWALGTPDLILEPSADFQIPPFGRDIYRCFTIPTGLLQNREVVGVEVRPGNRSVVHHIILFPDPTGASAKLLSPADPQPGYDCFGDAGFPLDNILGAWAPGNQPQVFPEGVGLPIKAGSRAVMQVHYHPTFRPETDRTRIGLYFARGPIQKELQLLFLVNDSFVIPAGDPHKVVTSSVVVPRGVNAKALAILPHMHLLGREIKLDVTYPDGFRRPLIYINDWNFDWQGTYYFKDPVPLTAGARIDMMNIYDNSADNSKNPNNPPKDVRFGEQTTDEMAVALVWFILD